MSLKEEKINFEKLKFNITCRGAAAITSNEKFITEV